MKKVPHVILALVLTTCAVWMYSYLEEGKRKKDAAVEANRAHVDEMRSLLRHAKRHCFIKWRLRPDGERWYRLIGGPETESMWRDIDLVHMRGLICPGDPKWLELVLITLDQNPITKPTTVQERSPQ